MKSRAIIAAFLFALTPVQPHAQNQPPIGVAQLWLPQSRLAAPVSVTSTPLATALPSLGQVAWICNTGAADAYLTFGTNGSITSSTTVGSWLKAGTCGAYGLVPNPGSFSPVYTFFAAATASSPTTLYVEAGLGTPPGATTTITVNQGTSPWVVSSTPYAYTPLGPMQAGLAITISTPLTIPATATYAVVCASGANVNYTTDGQTTPTSSVGMPLVSGQCVSLVGPLVLSGFRAIQQTATAVLNVSYFK